MPRKPQQMQRTELSRDPSLVAQDDSDFAQDDKILRSG